MLILDTHEAWCAKGSAQQTSSNSKVLASMLCDVQSDCAPKEGSGIPTYMSLKAVGF